MKTLSRGLFSPRIGKWYPAHVSQTSVSRFLKAVIICRGIYCSYSKPQLLPFYSSSSLDRDEKHSEYFNRKIKRQRTLWRFRRRWQDILKWILKNRIWVWIGFVCVRTGGSGCLLWKRQGTFGFRTVSLPDERLLASQWRLHHVVCYIMRRDSGEICLSQIPSE